MKRALDVIDRISVVTGRATALLVLPFVGVVLYEVVARFAFNVSAIWGHELTSFLYGGICLLASAWTLQQNRHVGIDVFSVRLSPKGKAVLSLVTYSFLFLPLIGIIFWQGIDTAAWAWRIRQHSWTAWGPPLYPIKMVIPVAVFLLLLQGIAKCARDLHYVIKRKQS